MAEAALMSKSNLTRKLKELIGLTPGDFLKEARIKKATELLKNTNMNISEIAYMCGFNDPKYFSKVFKSSIGKTPSEYRE
jgi:transcriptional regulator GlxA family with amidase domain